MTPHQNVYRLQDWIAETPESITERLAAAKESQAQIRFTLGIMAIISTMMLIASYNAYLSYDYHWILASGDRQPVAENQRGATTSTPETNDRKPASQNVSDILTEQALKDWASSRIVMISLLGIRVSVDDVVVLGPAVFFTLSLWLLLVARRSHHTITALLRSTDTPGSQENPAASGKQLTGSSQEMYHPGERWRIFHTISSHSLFFTFLSLNTPDLLKAGVAARFSRRLSRVGFKVVRSFFFLFPVLASFVVFCIDRYSYFIPDPFDPTFAIPGVKTFFWTSMVVFFACWIPLTICCWQSKRYSTATETVLHEYGKKLRIDLKQHQHFSQG